ncbi:hypothetical protein HWV62_34941 [Athelia sp. TMB]|nr:hypothetical protein HWV62_34941 [Athelia sp. TMB]
MGLEDFMFNVQRNRGFSASSWSRDSTAMRVFQSVFDFKLKTSRPRICDSTALYAISRVMADLIQAGKIHRRAVDLDASPAEIQASRSTVQTYAMSVSSSHAAYSMNDLIEEKDTRLKVVFRTNLLGILSLNKLVWLTRSSAYCPLIMSTPPFAGFSAYEGTKAALKV